MLRTQGKRVSETSEETDVEKLNIAEVKETMNRMKRCKAVGSDDIPVESWKVFGKTEVKWWLTTIF